MVGALVQGPLNPLRSVWQRPSVWAPTSATISYNHGEHKDQIESGREDQMELGRDELPSDAARRCGVFGSDPACGRPPAPRSPGKANSNRNDHSIGLNESLAMQ